MSLNLNFALTIKKCHVQMPIPGQYPEFQETSGSFQEWWNFEILYWKSSSLTENEWKRYPICWNQLKLANSRATSRVPENFWKFPGMMEFWNSVFKIKFLDINWVGFIPYMLKSVKTSQFQGTSGILESWIPGSRNHDISSNVRKINTNMLCRLFFNKIHKKTRFFLKKSFVSR